MGDNVTTKNVLVSVKYIFNELGYRMIPDYKRNLLVFSNGNNKIILDIKNKKFLVNDDGVNIEVHTDIQTISRKYYIPLNILSKVVNTNKINFAEDVPVLMYHHLLEKKDIKGKFVNDSAVIAVESFNQQMKILHEQGYTTITLDELEKYLKGEILLPEKSILITFDDGYKSNYVYAYPLLKQYGFRATVFIITRYIPYHMTEFNPEKLQIISWQEIQRSRDVFEFASHTHDLHRLNDKNISYVICKDKEEVFRDLKFSMEILDTKYLAYPYGQYNEETLNILRKLGYTLAFTIKPGKVKPGDDLLQLKRIRINPNINIWRFKKIIGVK
ncbi:polysaccharide deacetylase family protein [Caloranaerobacter azorensis]|uniref:polysaccharide deacetylase family protein n=1 Tax=Caloranaerobacter azorensis TaxID=116090 RepID=UPI00068CE88E|nr:polysaccharide deacetylase family protein [Caloranaerobacter azorensis]